MMANRNKKNVVTSDIQQESLNSAEEAEVSESIGNIFADLGLPDAEERLAKAELSIRIEELMQKQGLTQTQAATIMGLTQPDVSDIVHGRLKGYTLDRLFACLNALDQDIEIVIRPKQEAHRRGHVVVSMH